MRVMKGEQYHVIVVGGGHAGVEAVWAAANLLTQESAERGRPLVALVTLDPSKIGVMSCNPAIGGLAKGQLVREIDAMGGLMGLAADASGLNFKILNMSRGPAVRGLRAQCDKLAYEQTVQAMIRARTEIRVVSGAVQDFGICDGTITSVRLVDAAGSRRELHAGAVILTTGTFMRGLMHTGEKKTPGGRVNEQTCNNMSQCLEALGFELGRLKTGTPPRLLASSLDLSALEMQQSDASPTPFSELSNIGWALGELHIDRFPFLQQVECAITSTNAQIHEIIRNNLHRAPMYSGTIQGTGPRYCPAIEDKVVRFEERDSHTVFLEPESLQTDWIYANGISTSLPVDVQEQIVKLLPGCDNAIIAQHGYAVEYDMVRPHQIHASTMTKLVDGLFLAGQINGTSGYEEAAGQGLLAGINAVHHVRNQELIILDRSEAYIGVMMDDLVTKTPVEPYRMFTSRAEHRLTLRPDNAPDRLSQRAIDLGLLQGTAPGTQRIQHFAQRTRLIEQINLAIDAIEIDREPLSRVLCRPDADQGMIEQLIAAKLGDKELLDKAVLGTVLANRRYEAYVTRQLNQNRRQQEMERKKLPASLDYASVVGLRAEATEALSRFRPDTFGQASRLEGVTPADLLLLSVHTKRHAQASA